MIDKQYELQMDAIEAILNQADKFGLRWEVQFTAESMLVEKPDMDIVFAYECALGDWDCLAADSCVYYDSEIDPE